MKGTSGRSAEKKTHCLKSEQAMSLIRGDSGDYDDEDHDG